MGRTLPLINDDWIVDDVSADAIRLSNIRTGHVTNLGLDNVYSYSSNLDRSKGAIKYGFLMLKVQLYLQGNNVHSQPTFQPGQAVPWPEPQISEMWVDLKYPTDSGLQHKLAAAGFRIVWAASSQVARKIDLEGWELVVDEDTATGRLRSYHIDSRPEGLTLLKKIDVRG